MSTISTISTLSTVLIAVMLITLSSCKKGWSEKERQDYLFKCMEAEKVNERPEKVDREYCACMLQKTETKFPDPSDADKMDYKERIEWSAKCLGYQ